MPADVGSARRLGLVTLVVAGFLLVAGTALAYWSSAGTGSAAASTGTLQAPTAVSASGVGSVAVTWTASAGTTAPQGYYVVRTSTSDGSTAPACGTSRTTLTSSSSTSCTDTGVPAGTFTYAVSAVVGGWTATSASSATLVIASTGLLSFTTQPSGGTAGTALTAQPTVTMKNSNGTVQNETGVVTLVLTDPGSATLSCTSTTKSAVAGVATFAGCSLNRTGTYTMTATAAGKTSTTSNPFTITAAAASKVAFSTQPGGGTSQTAWAAQPEVMVQDAYGNTVTGNSSSVTLALTTPGGGSLTCSANPKAAVAGVATFAGCKVDKAGSYTVTATDPGLTSATSTSFAIAAGATTKLAFTTQPGGSTSGVPLSPQPVVTLQDAFGNTATTDASSVTLALTTAGGATLSCTANPKPATAGVATFAGCRVSRPGMYTLTASGTGLASATSGSFVIAAGAPAQVVFTTQPGTGTGGSSLATQPAVTVQDAGGNTVLTDTSSVTLALTTPGGATLACTANPQTAVAGVATFAGCKVDRAGTYTLTATDGSLASATSSSFTVTVGAAAKVAFSTQPGGGVSQSALATQPVVTVQDAGGNPVTTSTSSVSLALTPPGGATLACTANPKPAVAGVATFAGCKVDKVGTYTLSATAPGLTPATSGSFTVTVGAAAKVAFTTQPGGGASQATWTTQPVVAVQDAGGNTVTTDTSSVTLTLTTPGGGTLACTPTTSKAAVSGVATFAGCKVDKAGSYTLTAIDGSLAAGASSSFTITAGVGTQLRYTNATGTTATCATGTVTVSNGGSLTTWVAILDAFGNLTTAPLTPTAITLAKGAGGGNAPTPTTLTVLGGANPAVTSGSSVFKLPNGQPAATTYTATSPGLSSTSCTISR